MKHDMKKMTTSFLWGMVVSVACGLAGCEASDFDFDDGWDTNRTDSSAVTVDTIQGIDASMYGKARMFPGLVDTLTEHRIADTLVALDLSRKYASMEDLCLKRLWLEDTEEAPQPIYSTGLFAGAGELVTIYVPEDVWGLTVQIGMQTEDLTHNNAGLREPVVYIQKALYPGKNTVRSSLGGYIWVLRDRNTEGAADTKIKFCGVYAAPDFIVGETDKAEWTNKIRTTTVPWLDIRGKHVTFSVERNRMEMYLASNPDFANEMEQAVKLWDELVYFYYHSLGMDEEAGRLPEMMPQFTDRFVFDVQLSVNDVRRMDNPQGLMFIKTAGLYDAMVTLDSVARQQLFNVYDQLVERYQPVQKPLSDSYDETFFVPIYRLAEYTWKQGINSGLGDMGISFTQAEPLALAFAGSDTVKYRSTDLTTWWNEKAKCNNKVFGLLPLVQIAKYESRYKQEEEWTAFRKLWTKVREEGYFSRSDLSFYSDLCEYFGVDLTPFLEHWGYTISDGVRSEMAKYPLLDKEIWKIEPSADDPYRNVQDYDVANHPVRVNRYEWEILALDSAGNVNEDTEYKNEKDKLFADNLIDGNPYTYWSSYLSPWENNYQDSPRSLPYYVIIDMGQSQTMDGFYYANGNVRCVSSFKVQATEATGFDLKEHELQEWHDIGQVSQTSVSGLKNERFVGFDKGRVSARYLRLVFDKPNLYEPSETDSLGMFEKYHQYRQQKFSEFGTYYKKGN